MIKEQIKKKLKIIFYPLALIILFITEFFKSGVKKIRAQGMILVYELPWICGTPLLRKPSLAEIIEYYLSQKPVTIISILVILIFLVYLYRIIKHFFIIQFSTWQLIRETIKHCFIWSFLYCLLLAIVFILVPKILKFDLDDLRAIISMILLFIHAFLVFNLISGIELLLISIKDRRFLVSGLILFFIPLLVVLVLYFFTSNL